MKLNRKEIIDSYENDLSIKEILSLKKEKLQEHSFFKECFLKEFLTPTHLISVEVDEAMLMYQLYYKAITKHSKYMLPYYQFEDMVTTKDPGYMGTYKYKNSYIHGFWKLGFFCISHFAPYTLREGAEMISFLKRNYNNILFAVTDNLANQLEKLGYYFQGTCLRPFGNDLVTKYIYTSSPEVYFH